MVIVMQPGAAESELADVVQAVHAAGGKAFVSRGVSRTIVGVVAGEEVLESLDVRPLPGVADVLRITAPYKLVSRENHPRTSTIHVGDVPIGPGTFTLIAGPCSVEGEDMILRTAEFLRGQGVRLMRAGAFKPRTSPYAFQGMGQEGLDILARARARTGVGVVTELMDTDSADAVEEVADVIQVGARNMQNYSLLTELGRAGVPVLLKRGLSASLEELLMAAEYVLKEGNDDVILCERGIRTFESAYRFTLDLMAIPVLKEQTHLPVVIDPSHATGRRDWVLPMSLAAAAAGADGIIVEIHPEPEAAICDGPQQLVAEGFPDYLRRVEEAAALAGKALSSV